jgi:4a-hydroxytetrahydrobiopterin dehydratase
MPALIDKTQLPDWKQKLDSGWNINDAQNLIYRDFKFKDYYQTMAFVNSVAWIAHQSDHHPDLTVSYNRCRVNFSTHSASGLTELDFNCAQAIDRLLES